MTVAPPPFKRCAASSVRCRAMCRRFRAALCPQSGAALYHSAGKKEKKKKGEGKKEKEKGKKGIKKREPGDFSSSSPLGGDYLLSHFRSTIGVVRLNFSVRNGKRWDPHAIIT